MTRDDPAHADTELRLLRARVAELEALLASPPGPVEEALRESEERYRTVLMALDAGVVFQLADGSIQAWNASAERILGLSADQLQGRTSVDPRWRAIHEDGSPFPGDEHPAMVTLRTGQPCDHVVMGVHKPDGSLTWIMISSRPLLHPGQPAPYAVVASFIDITERKYLEDKLREREDQFGLLMTHSLDAMLLTAPDGQIFAANPAATEMFGYSEGELCAGGRNLIVDTSDPRLGPALAERARTGSFRGELTFRRRDGSYFPVELSSGLFQDRRGNQRSSMAIRDISERKRAEAALRASEERFAALYQVAALLNSSVEIESILQTVVESAAAILPANRAVLITVDMAARRVTQLIEGGPGAAHGTQMSFSELWHGLSGVALRERRAVRSPSGSVDDHESSAVRQRRIRDRAGSILVVPLQTEASLFGTLTAINRPGDAEFTEQDTTVLAALASQAAIVIERARLLHELQYQATTDALTQLLNRRAWFDYAERAVAAAQRSQRPLGVILLDADHFKQINDRYGHDAGDLALRAIAACCRQSVRISDVVGRYGGEEFVILLPDTDAPAAWAIAERIRSVVEAERIFTPEASLAVTVSLGVATAQARKLDLSALLTQADQALYSAKQDGRNCVRMAP